MQFISVSGGSTGPSQERKGSGQLHVAVLSTYTHGMIYLNQHINVHTVLLSRAAYTVCKHNCCEVSDPSSLVKGLASKTKPI